MNGKMERNSKIFVAGGTGLVGSAIIKNLIEKGYENIVANYHSRPPAATHGSPIAWKKLDLLDLQAVKAYFDAETPEYVFLAAAKVGGIVANNTYRAEFIYENLQIQNNVIHQSFLHDVKKLMFLGSTCIYPRECPQPMKEAYLLTAPLEYTNEPYAIAKIAGIKMCESYNLQYGTNYIAVMPTNLYGPNDNFDLEKSHVLPALIRKLHLGKCLENNDWNAVRADLNRLPIEGIDGSAPEAAISSILAKYGVKALNAADVAIEIWGSGAPMREFLWSEDMADACVFLMKNRDFSEIARNAQAEAPGKASDPLHAEIRNTHINIGSGKDISVRELAETIKATVGFGGELYFNTDKPDGTMKKLTDVSKLHGFGWRHTVELREGIQRMYNWYKGVDA